MPEDKLQKIISIIQSEAEERQKHIIEAAQKRFQEEMQRAENDVLQESFDLVQRRAKKIRDQAGQNISAAQRNARRLVFEKRNALTDEIFRQAAEQILRYTQGPEYKTLLENSAKKIAALCKGQAIVTLRPADQAFEKDLAALFAGRASFVYDDSLNLGGMRVLDQECNVSYDDTLETRLSSQKDWFMEHSGLVIS